MYDKKIEIVGEAYRKLQDRACTIVEKAEGSVLFSKDPWEKIIGKGNTRVMKGGDKIAKAAINYSMVSGNYSDSMAKAAGKDPGNFSATGVSSIIHPVNPYVPIIHMNVRYFEMKNGTRWFGGGIDLTPHYIDIEESRNFHKALKTLCNRFDINFYPLFKKEADNYFFLPHRQETRGIGGIFFDHKEPDNSTDFDKYFEFTKALITLYPELYVSIMEKKHSIPYGEKEILWQNYRRSRYVEFNLLYDRGTKFGLVSGGNTESILVSMPPVAAWDYNYKPEPGSNEEKTLNLLKKDIDWISFNG